MKTTYKLRMTQISNPFFRQLQLEIPTSPFTAVSPGHGVTLGNGPQLKEGLGIADEIMILKHVGVSVWS